MTKTSCACCRESVRERVQVRMQCFGVQQSSAEGRWLSVQSCPIRGKRNVETPREKNIGSESTSARESGWAQFWLLNLCHLEVLVRHLWPAEKWRIYLARNFSSCISKGNQVERRTVLGEVFRTSPVGSVDPVRKASVYCCRRRLTSSMHASAPMLS